MSWLEHKSTLAFILLIFPPAKWTKSKPTFLEKFKEVWQFYTKDISNKNLGVYKIFLPFCLFHDIVCLSIFDLNDIFSMYIYGHEPNHNMG
jgi:hypothetical protein